jgi:DNA polymerase type B, organellar and viral
MRNAYYGGVVEVFKNEGENLKLYDVTSLYPFAMLQDMPTGDMLFSTDSDINNYFGIVFVEVDTTNLDPKYSNYPLLAHKIDGRMYNPLGSWSGWYFSEEVKLAISYGYNIKVLYGYKFDKSSNVFSSFINKFFAVKAGLSDINMDRTTAKLILNSMYGRLGMKPYQDNVEIVDSSKALEILSKFNVKEQYNLTDNLEFIRYENEPITGFLELYGKDEYLNFILDLDSKNISVNQSLPSAIAITAYARMYMFKVIYRLLELGIEVYYMDTDSIVVNKRIPEELIGNKLGLFKLEHEIEHGYFISPKLYSLKLTNGETIVKAKGIGNKLEFNQFETLIKNQGIIKAQERWFKDPANANISIKNIDMHISSLNLKRRQFMDNNRLSYTSPLYIKNQIILKNK